MKLSQNEQLIILILFIIACVIFISYTCQSKKENFSMLSISQRQQNFINNIKSLSTKLNLTNQQYTNEKPQLLLMNTTPNTVYALFINKNCLIIVTHTDETYSSNTMSTTFGNTNTTLQYLNNNFILNYNNNDILLPINLFIPMTNTTIMNLIKLIKPYFNNYTFLNGTSTTFNFTNNIM
jgi:hypothetical protein